MRKSAIALTSLGVGAGVIYAIGRGRSKNRRRGSATLNAEESDVGKSKTNTHLKDRQSKNESNASDKAPSMAPIKDGEPELPGSADFELDDRGTDQQEALQLLEKIKTEAFESSDDKLALALGRPVEEINAWETGELNIDSDVLMKARALARERGVNTAAD